MSELKIRADGVAWQEVDDDLIVLDEQRATYMRLVGSATLLWPQLVAGTTSEQLADELVKAFGLDRVQAEHDVGAFVAGLSEQGLLASPA